MRNRYRAALSTDAVRPHLLFFAFLVIAWMQASLEFGVLNWFLLMASASLGVLRLLGISEKQSAHPGLG